MSGPVLSLSQKTAVELGGLGFDYNGRQLRFLINHKRVCGVWVPLVPALEYKRVSELCQLNGTVQRETRHTATHCRED
jgi:hypothetical protein